MFRATFFYLPVLLLFVATGQLANSAPQKELSKTGLFKDISMGLSFKPPAGLRDMTTPLKQKHATGSDISSEFDFLLRMSSGPDVNSPGWGSVIVATYPRGRDRDTTDDTVASFFTNRVLVPGTIVDRGVIKYSGYQFSVCIIENREEPTTRYVTVYTTVQRENFISFVFAGNTRKGVDKLTRSMSTVKLVP